MNELEQKLAEFKKELREKTAQLEALEQERERGAPAGIQSEYAKKLTKLRGEKNSLSLRIELIKSEIVAAKQADKAYEEDADITK
ncbi:MAG: hypothetical protein LBM01_02030 [Christensenellaceae bacterium]|jgi:chromosome segregation ATPase|nr:hypothetical protein [Christensenellaceae bacterium]